MAERDVKKNERLWKTTKEKNYDLKHIPKENRELIIEFLKDFELGINTPKKSRGVRTPGTLLKLRNFCVFLNRQFPKKDFTKITKEDLHKLFRDMSNGDIRKPNGYIYKDIGDVIKNTRTFIRWMERKEVISEDITEDLSVVSYKKQKPAWVYLKEKEIVKLNDSASAEYRPLMVFLYDSGLRAEELFRIKVEDFKEDYTILHVPKYREDGQKVSKTFERTIKLMKSAKLIKNYIETNNLKQGDLLIQKSQIAFRKYLKRLAVKLFGDVKTGARGYVHEINLTDIRHWASIYWLDKYKTNKDLMYRMGWAKEDKVFYYSEFLGRRDKINDDDMFTLEDKTKVEKEIDGLKQKGQQRDKILLKLLKFAEIIQNNPEITENIFSEEKEKVGELFTI